MYSRVLLLYAYASSIERVQVDASEQRGQRGLAVEGIDHYRVLNSMEFSFIGIPRQAYVKVNQLHTSL